MNRIFLGLCVLASTIILSSCNPDDSKGMVAGSLDQELEAQLVQSSDNQDKTFYLLPDSDDLSVIPQDPNNLLTPQKVLLGKLLYHETGLGQNPKHSEGMNTYSCASCHHARAGFQACLPQGIGDGGSGFGVQGEGRKPSSGYRARDLDVQPIRTPSILNVAYQELMLWNGQFGATGGNVGTESEWTKVGPLSKNYLGFEGVETQALAGRDVHRLVIDKIFMENVGDYKSLYEKAFEPSTFFNPVKLKNNGALAIAAYERTVMANQSPFQQWLRGNYNAMDETEKKGALLFFGKANCASCHNGPNLANMDFVALGMKDLENGSTGNTIISNVNPNDGAHKGRGGFTKKDEDMYQFKVPQLYNLKDSPFYGHGASFTSIRDVIIYKNKAEKENDRVSDQYLSESFKPLDLSEEEIDQLTSFIENSLHDPNLERYVPEKLPSGLAFPNNDNSSKVDLGF